MKFNEAEVKQQAMRGVSVVRGLLDEFTAFLDAVESHLSEATEPVLREVSLNTKVNDVIKYIEDQYPATRGRSEPRKMVEDGKASVSYLVHYWDRLNAEYKSPVGKKSSFTDLTHNRVDTSRLSPKF